MVCNVRNREDIDDKYKWRIEDIYEKDEFWENDLELYKKLGDKIYSYKGKVILNADNLYEVLKLNEKFLRIGEKLNMYARKKYQQNMRISKDKELLNKFKIIENKINDKLVFYNIELMELNNKKLNEYIKERVELAEYKFYFENILKDKKYILSEAEEKILNLSKLLLKEPFKIFEMYTNVDIKFLKIIDLEGNKINITKGNFGKLIKSENRDIRKKAFQSYFGAYEKNKTTLAEMYIASVEAYCFETKVRGYKSPLQRMFYSDNISSKVYNNLIDIVSNNVDLVNRYFSIRKKILGVDTLHKYDLYVPIVKDIDKNIEYNKAVSIVADSLKLLGFEYVENFFKGVNSRWIDVYQTEGKKRGGFHSCYYDTHSYISLNYDGRIDKVFTLAHEMGHALHAYYSNNNQSYQYAKYKSFLLEIASTVNEVILLKYMLKKSKDKDEKRYMLDNMIKKINETIFVPVELMQFEKEIYCINYNEKGLTEEKITNIYYNIDKKYFGEQLNIDDIDKIYWMTKEQLYSPFYIYKYAIGFCVAIAFVENIEKQGKRAINNYLEFLKSGSIDYPIRLLQKAGVDLTLVDPIQSAMKFYERILDEFESIIDN